MADQRVTALDLLEVARQVELGKATAEHARIIVLACCQLPFPSGIEQAYGRSVGAMKIVSERIRQVLSLGYTPEHDQLHTSDELAAAGAAYALPLSDARRTDAMCFMTAPEGWPFERAAWRPARVFDAGDGKPGVRSSDRIRELEKAGALIAAAIDLELANAGGAS